MNKLSLSILFFSISLSIFAGNGLTGESKMATKSVDSQVRTTNLITTDDIVINFSLIEKFNKAEYSSDHMGFTSLMKDYSFQEIKQISQAYRSGEIEVLNKVSVEQYLKKNKVNDNNTWLHLYSEIEVPRNLE